jgi:hypothetical protein
MVTKLRKGQFEEEQLVEERFVGEGPSKSTKIAADLAFTDVTEGGIPITEAERIARENVEVMGKPFKPLKDYIVNPVSKAWDKVGIKVVDKLNPLDDDFFQSRKIKAEKYDLDKRKAFSAYREKRDKTKDMLGVLLEKYKTKADEVRVAQGDEAADAVLEEYFNSKARILKSGNLIETDLHGTPIDLDTYMLRDDMDLWTDNPDPYPWIQFGQEFAASVFGMNKGYKAGEKLLTTKNLQKLNKVFKGVKGGPWYVRLGAWAGRGATHPWTIKTIGSLGGGSLGWGAADLGYEFELDALNAAGKGKAYLEASDDVRAQLISKAIPEALTFGPQGINRPGLSQRIFNAADEAVTDAALTAPFFFLRPAYVGLRTMISKAPGVKMMKEPGKKVDLFSERTAIEDLDNAEMLFKKYGGDLVQAEKAGFNVPFIGNMLTRIAESNIFDWISTGGLGLLSKTKPKGKIGKYITEGFETPSVLRAEEQIAMPMGKHMFSESYISMASRVLGRAPWLGGWIKTNLQRNSDAWLTTFHNMLGHMAPISHLAGNRALDFSRIMSKGAGKFRTKAKEMSDKIVKISETKVDTPISDKFLRDAGKKVIKERKRFWQSKVDPETGKATLVPPQGGDPVVNFIETQILKANTTGARSVPQYMALKAAIQELYEKSGNLILPVEKDVVTLLKGWDNDIGALAHAGFDDLSKAFKEYDEFVANGMMIYGSDIAKKAGLDMSQTGMNLKISWNDKRTAQGLFDTVIKSGTAQDVKIIKKLVGDQAFADGVDIYIRNAFNKALTKSTGGVREFNFTQFRNAIGLGKGQSIEKAIFKEALNNEKVIIRGMDPKTGLKRDFQDEMWVGLAPSGRFIDDAAEFAKKVDGDVIRTKVPSLEDFDKLISVLERVYKHGVPDVSTFMARKAVISSTSRGLTAFLPWSGAGTTGAAYASGLISGQMVTALAGAFLMRYGGKVLSSAPSMRVFRNTIDDTLPATVRLANFQKLILRHPEEWDAFNMDLLELEEAQKQKDMGAKRMRDVRGTGEKLKDNIMNLGGEILEHVPDVIKLGNKVIGRDSSSVPIKNIPAIEEDALNSGVDGAVEALEADEMSQATPQPTAPATAGFGGGNAAPGSSLAMNTSMNPDAAGALYMGDTDAALAAQYGGGAQYAAEGGMMQMNPIMDNQGNYTEPQTGINDNPFINKGKNEGILSIL